VLLKVWANISLFKQAQLHAFVELFLDGSDDKELKSFASRLASGFTQRNLYIITDTVVSDLLAMEGYLQNSNIKSKPTPTQEKLPVESHSDAKSDEEMFFDAFSEPDTNDAKSAKPETMDLDEDAGEEDNFKNTLEALKSALFAIPSEPLDSQSSQATRPCFDLSILNSAPNVRQNYVLTSQVAFRYLKLVNFWHWTNCKISNYRKCANSL
jgi:hypothetical protein